MDRWVGHRKVAKFVPPWKNMPSTSKAGTSSAASGDQPSVSSTVPEAENLVAIDGTPLVPVSRLPHKYRSVFYHRFAVFNVVQSRVFDDVFDSHKSIALCAPTGSGKTVVFELAIIKQLMDFDAKNQPMSELKVVYMAPLKKLVDEKFKEFRDSFNRFGLNCFQYTGDTELDDHTWLSSANVILTTPEKWDAMVRVNRNSSLIRNIQIMLIDEVHSISDDQRGATMEAVISRMKILRNVFLKESNDSNKIRFIAVSATAPNVADIAHWLDPVDNSGHNLAANVRPVRIQTIVLGYGCNDDTTEFKFDITLNYKIDSVIRSHCDSKPTLIFCSTRKSVEMLAKHLSSSSGYSFNERQKLDLRVKLSTISFKDKNLKNYIQKGVGFHHSGLELKDRQQVENLFLINLIPVLVSTTTLSMGVNLPAHLVIIKNTVQFEPNGVVKEYQATQVMQMIGRAGRPQFDTSAVAVIMTKSTKKIKYEMLLNGSQIIESKLHEHLIEHLNAEISLQTVTSIDIAVDWIRSTFLYIRLLQNPKRYSSTIQISNIQEGLQVLRDWCQKELVGLKNSEMILSFDDDFRQVSSSAVGQLMARHCISFTTMRNFSQIILRDVDLKEVIDQLSKTQELIQEIQLRNNDKKFLNELNASKDQPIIRFPFSGRIKSADMKISCLVQAMFGSMHIPDYTLSQEALRVIRTGQRLIRCLADVIIFKVQQNIDKIYFRTLLNIMIVNKCFKAKLWHDSRQVIKQMQGIGAQYSKAIMSHYKNFEEIKKANPREIEFICGNRKPPFGTTVIDWVKKLPHYSLTIIQNIEGGLKRNCLLVKIKITLENYEELKTKELNRNHSFFIIVGNNENQLFYYQQWNDSKLLKTNGSFEIKEILIERSPQLETIYAHLISDSIVGVDVRCALTPVFAADAKTPPEPSWTNCSTAYSNVECKTEVRPDFSEGCQHKCANKSSCRHSCCKKGINSHGSQRCDPEVGSQRQTNPINKRQLSNDQNNTTNKKNKTAKAQNSGLSVPQNNLDKWLIKFPKISVPSAECSEEVATHSKYFDKYSEIQDNDIDLDIDFTEFDNELQEFDLETDVMQTDEQMEMKSNEHLNINRLMDDQIDDQIDIKPIIKVETEVPIETDENVFDDEFEEELEKLLEYNPTLKNALEPNEDFQTFDNNCKPESNENNENTIKGRTTIFHASEWPGLEYWRVHFPPGDLEGQTFYDERPQ